MPREKETLTVVVSGVATEVDVRPHAPLRRVIRKALEQTGNEGQPPREWELKDAAGNVLDPEAEVEDLHFTPGTKLFLSPKAGVGG